MKVKKYNIIEFGDEIEKKHVHVPGLDNAFYNPIATLPEDQSLENIYL